jgi:hypothetical protein
MCLPPSVIFCFSMSSLFVNSIPFPFSNVHFSFLVLDFLFATTRLMRARLMEGSFSLTVNCSHFVFSSEYLNTFGDPQKVTQVVFVSYHATDDCCSGTTSIRSFNNKRLHSRHSDYCISVMYLCRIICFIHLM